MRTPSEIGRSEMLEALLRSSDDVLGGDSIAYGNHAHRVFHFARALGLGDGEPDAERKLAIVCFFHDLGIWTDRTFDYIEPSVALAVEHLGERGLSAWETEVSGMIRNHHKLTPVAEGRSSAEIFRRADWIDVSLGIRRFGVPWAFVREVQRAFPDQGFHRRLVELFFSRLRSHPFDPLPMFRW